MIRADAPESNDALRRALYEGEVFLRPPTAASARLVADALDVLRAELGCAAGEDPRTVQARLAPEDFFARMGRVRKALYLEPRFHRALRDVVAAGSFDPERVAFDPLRMRVIAHRGHEDPRAAAVYYPHRDTWYGHPQALVAWWIPLDDLPAEETFVFFPGRFASAVPNDSEVFDYAAWVRDGWSLKIGWQDRDAGLRARYPGVRGEHDPGPAVGFACRRGENLLFAGAHFHRTRPHAAGRTRFSLDFRLVHLDDHARGLGAPNVDNRSRGSALPDYVHPGVPAPETIDQNLQSK